MHWNAEKCYVKAFIRGDLNGDDCIELRKDALAMASGLKEKGISDIRVLLKISDTSETHTIEERNKILLVEGLKFVDRLAVFTEEGSAKEEALKIFDISHFVFEKIYMRVFEKREDALKWLLK
jgi:hypothetical protein